MTYCVAVKLNAGLVFLSDSRTNAGLDRISMFRKMSAYEKPGDRFMVLLSAGNLSISQSIREILQIEQSTTLMQDLGRGGGMGVGGGVGRLIRPRQAIVDLGFRGKEVDAANPGLEIIHRGRIKSLNKEQRSWLKRRQAIEPAIGHLKSDCRMQRCWLKGETGDALHALCCAVGYNIRWLMRAASRLSLRGFLLGVLGVVQLAGWAGVRLVQA